VDRQVQALVAAKERVDETEEKQAGEETSLWTELHPWAIKVDRRRPQGSNLRSPQLRLEEARENIKAWSFWHQFHGQASLIDSGRSSCHGTPLYLAPPSTLHAPKCLGYCK